MDAASVAATPTSIQRGGGISTSGSPLMVAHARRSSGGNSMAAIPPANLATAYGSLECVKTR